MFCGCGRRPVELKEPHCCRLSYGRRYRSLRFFGGLREVVLKRDRFRCRACGASARLVVHHRSGDNQKRRLITLCVGCHTRVHRYRALRSWVPEVLVNWKERHPSEPVQLQLPFGIRHRVSRSVALHHKKPDPSGREVAVRFMEAARLSVGLDVEFQPEAITGSRTHIFGARTTAGAKPANAVTV
jgi:hypothetical protein